jgi:hypothetical protein
VRADHPAPKLSPTLSLRAARWSKLIRPQPALTWANASQSESIQMAKIRPQRNRCFEVHARAGE